MAHRVNWRLECLMEIRNGLCMSRIMMMIMLRNQQTEVCHPSLGFINTKHCFTLQSRRHFGSHLPRCTSALANSTEFGLMWRLHFEYLCFPFGVRGLHKARLNLWRIPVAPPKLRTKDSGKGKSSRQSPINQTVSHCLPKLEICTQDIPSSPGFLSAKVELGGSRA